MADAAPLRLVETPIRRPWLDYNDHLNVASYVLIFDMAGVALFDHLGMGEAYSRETGGSWVVLESHLTYDREVLADDVVSVETRFVDHDAKRLHLYHEMHIASGGGPAATCEQMTMFFDLRTRRAAPFPEHVARAIDRIGQGQAALPRPKTLGRTIGIRR